jgi:hypothetical protein
MRTLDSFQKIINGNVNYQTKLKKHSYITLIFIKRKHAFYTLKLYNRPIDTKIKTTSAFFTIAKLG